MAASNATTPTKVLFRSKAKSGDMHQAVKLKLMRTRQLILLTKWSHGLPLSSFIWRKITSITFVSSYATPWHVSTFLEETHMEFLISVLNLKCLVMEIRLMQCRPLAFKLQIQAAATMRKAWPTATTVMQAIVESTLRRKRLQNLLSWRSERINNGGNQS